MRKLDKNRKLIEDIVIGNREPKEKLRKVEEEMVVANELFKKVAKNSGHLLKLKEVFEFVRAMEEKPEVKRRVYGRIYGFERITSYFSFPFF